MSNFGKFQKRENIQIGNSLKARVADLDVIVLKPWIRCQKCIKREQATPGEPSGRPALLFVYVYAYAGLECYGEVVCVNGDFFYKPADEGFIKFRNVPGLTFKEIAKLCDAV